MKTTIVALVLALCVMLPGCDGKTREAREYLLAHGFKRSATDRDIYERKNVRLGEVSRDLGFRLDALKEVGNDSPHTDTRIVEVKGLYFVVRSEVRDEKGRVVERSLDDPNALCSVGVCVNPVLRGTHRKPDSAPRMRIKSVAVPKDRSQTLRVTFELAAEGNTPLVISRGDFYITVSTQESPKWSVGSPASFSWLTPSLIYVSPGKPIVLAARTRPDPFRYTALAGLPPGQYVVWVDIRTAKPAGTLCDYHWEGEKHSDEYKLVVKDYGDTTR